MFEPNDIHIVLIGNDRVLDYRINLEILRYNFSFGDRLWITTVYNGDENGLPSGIGENTFIHIPENRGYGYGALDGFNHGLNFAADGYRPIVMLFNFDVWFFTEKGFVECVEEFIDSGKMFGAGFLPDHDLPMTDCMMFQRSFLKKILPINDVVDKRRQSIEAYKKMYENTELGWENMEEWFIGSMRDHLGDKDEEGRLIDLKRYWHIIQRDGAPRYRWTERFTLAHEHDYNTKKEKLKQHGTTKGQLIPKFLNGEFG